MYVRALTWSRCMPLTSFEGRNRAYSANVSNLVVDLSLPTDAILPAFMPTESGCVSFLISFGEIFVLMIYWLVCGYLHGFFGYLVVRLDSVLYICSVYLPRELQAAAVVGGFGMNTSTLENDLRNSWFLPLLVGIGIGDLFPSHITILELTIV
jgi:hypothetical protein